MWNNFIHSILQYPVHRDKFCHSWKFPLTNISILKLQEELFNENINVWYIFKGYLYLYCKQMSFFKIRNCKNATIATLDVCKHEIQHDHMYMYHHIPSNPWQNTAAQAWLTWSSCRLFVPNKKKKILLQLTKYVIIYYFKVHLLGKSFMYMYTKHSKWILNLKTLIIYIKKKKPTQLKEKPLDSINIHYPCFIQISSVNAINLWHNRSCEEQIFFLNMKFKQHYLWH